MRIREPRRLPHAQDLQVRRAVRLQWVSLGAFASVIGVMAMAMGSSQAMKTAWVEDALSLVPPIAFLSAVRVRRKPPSERYPYGHHRVMSIAFLVAAVTLCAFGVLLIGDAIAALIRREHPTVGTVTLFGRQVWQGWVMIAALAYSTVPPVVLGTMKLPLARELHAKVLHADAMMNKADWMTGGAGMLGVVGIGFGLWWADSAAALAISWSVLNDGLRALKTVIEDLMDRAPVPVDGRERFDVVEKIERYVGRLSWVAEHEVRLREEGDVCVGEIFIVPRATDDLPQRLEEVARTARGLDWRIYDLVATALPSLDGRKAERSEGDE